MTVAQLVAALDPPDGRVARTLRVERRGAVLAPHVPLSRLDLRSGDQVSVVDIGPGSILDEGPDPSAQPTASLRILTGPLAGRTFRLGPGVHTVGRASRNDLVLADPGLSRHHATLSVDASTAVVTDLGATNGIRIEGLPIDGPTALRSGQRLLLGQSWVAVDHHPVPVAPVAGRVVFDRPQRLSSAYQGRAYQVPAPPELGQTTGRIGHLTGRGNPRQVSESYDRMIDQVVADLALGRCQERDARLDESPSIDDVLLGVRARTRLWERRLTDPDVLRVRLGLAELSTRNRVDVEPGGPPELRARVDRLPTTYGTIDGVPATVDLGHPGGLTLRGPLDLVRDLAAALVGQLVGLNPPDQLGVALFGEAVETWDWLKWLPHADLLGTGRPPVGDEVVEAVGRFLDAAGGERAPNVDRPPFLVVIVDGSAALADGTAPGASELVRLMARGAERGLHPLLLAGELDGFSLVTSGLFGSAVTVDRQGDRQVGRLTLRGDRVQIVEPVALETADRETVVELARLLAPLTMRSAAEAPPPVAGGEPDRFLAVRPLVLGPIPPGGGARRATGRDRSGRSERGEPDRAKPQGDAPDGHAPDGDVPGGEAPPGEVPGGDEEAVGGNGDGGGLGVGVGVGGDGGPVREKELPDLLDLPRSDDDSRLVLGTFRMPDAREDAFLAFSPPRDHTLGLIGPPEANASRCLLTVAAATTRIDVPCAELPVVYAIGVGDHLACVGTLPNVAAVVDDTPEEVFGLLTELEQLMDDRLLTLELAGVDTFGDFRAARPGVTLRRVLVLLDGLDRLTDRLESDHPGRAREVVGQLLELGPGLGLHLAFTAEDRRGVDPLLVPKIGRWLRIDHDPEAPARVILDGAEVRFAVPGGAWDADEIEKGLMRLAAGLSGCPERATPTAM